MRGESEYVEGVEGRETVEVFEERYVEIIDERLKDKKEDREGNWRRMKDERKYQRGME